MAAEREGITMIEDLRATSGDTERMLWAQMKARCSNPKHPTWDWYGGRGTRVCARWAGSFEAFLSDMGPKPSQQYTLDRIDWNGHFEPGNCRWVTRAQKARARQARQMTAAVGDRAA
jgi:hypothetical protein